jgi:large subunit ribosomal protein L31e
MAKLERIYNIPLRKGFRNVVRYRKSKKAVITLKTFIKRHMKCSLENIKIGPKLNLAIWEKGMKNPPHHVKVTAIKEDDIVKVELFGHKYPETEEKKEKAEKKKQDKVTTEKEEPSEEKSPEKKEIKTLKEEKPKETADKKENKKTEAKRDSEKKEKVATEKKVQKAKPKSTKSKSASKKTPKKA